MIKAIYENIDEAGEQFAKALHRQSYLIFDNLGLHARVIDLPTYPVYRLCSDMMKGSGPSFTLKGRLSRLWCNKLRPWLLPERQKLIEKAYKEIRLLQRQALLDHIIEQAEEAGLYNYDKEASQP